MKERLTFPASKLQLREISKTFPGVKALSDVSLDIRMGEVHAICGENGAGKSTLMKILTGNHKPDAGAIIFDGVAVEIQNQKQAGDLGISIVYQERSLVGKLNVAENIFSRNKPRNSFGLIDGKKLYAQTRSLLHTLKLGHIHPHDRVEKLSAANQQMVEIAKALAQNPEILILDEPTASITEREADTLFGIIRNLKVKGVAVVYISHRMSEIFEIADRVTILKDGKHQGTFPCDALSIDDVIRLMVGRELDLRPKISHAGGEVVLEVKNLSGRGFTNINFQVRKGEVLGLAGLVGAGRTEVARAVFGVDPVRKGEIKIHGQKKTIKHPADAIGCKMGYVPEDRKELGLFLNMNIKENIISGGLSMVSNGVWVDNNAVDEIAEEYRKMLNIKCTGTHQKSGNLSGGNQQKVVLAKWLSLAPDILIVDEPTHGIDIGAKQEIYDILKGLTLKGVAILLISSELPEVIALSDRIVVMWNGNVSAELTKEEASEERILHYASGIENINNGLNH